MKLNLLGFFATLSLLILSACGDTEPRDMRTEPKQQMRGIADLAAPSGYVLESKDTLYVRSTRVTHSYDSIYTELRPYKAGPVVVEPPVEEPVKGYQLTFESGFDKLADINSVSSQQFGSGKISTTNYVTGPGSFYSIPANVSSGTRSEVQYTASSQLVNEGAIEYDVYYEVIVPSNIHSFQWHPNTSGASASPGLLHEGGKFTIMKFRKSGNEYLRTGVSIPLKKWVKMRWEFKFGNSGAYLRLYMDGKQIVDDKTGWLGDGSGQYPKIGVNGWGSDATKSRVYYDNLKIYKKI